MKQEFRLSPGETMSFNLVFERSKNKIYDLGTFQVKSEPFGDKNGEARLSVDLKIDSRFKAINTHSTGFAVISTDFMNILKADYVIRDMKRTIFSKISFDPSQNKISLDETVMYHKDKNEKPLTNVAIGGPSQIYDQLTLLYKLRSLDLRQTEIVSLAVLYYRKLWPILVEYQYVEEADFNSQKVECRVYGLRSNKGKLTELRRYFELRSAKVWVSDDDRRLPIRIELNTQEGNIVALLKQHSTS